MRTSNGIVSCLSDCSEYVDVRFDKNDSGDLRNLTQTDTINEGLFLVT
jgi:hypothetical protein